MRLNKSTVSQVENAMRQIEIVDDTIAELLQLVQDYIDDRSDKWQDSDAGLATQEQLDNLQEAQDTLASVVRLLENAISGQ